MVGRNARTERENCGRILQREVEDTSFSLSSIGENNVNENKYKYKVTTYYATMK